jgi:hypothetical protein
MNIYDRLENSYRRGFGNFQIRTKGGRLLAHDNDRLRIQHLLLKGKDRVLWYRHKEQSWDYKTCKIIHSSVWTCYHNPQ